MYALAHIARILHNLCDCFIRQSPFAWFGYEFVAAFDLLAVQQVRLVNFGLHTFRYYFFRVSAILPQTKITRLRLRIGGIARRFLSIFFYPLTQRFVECAERVIERCVLFFAFPRHSACVKRAQE